VLAKSEARQYFRSERRRRLREENAARRETQPHSNQMLMISKAAEEEFVNTLTRSERAYYEAVLISPSNAGIDDGYSAENGWQLRRRVRKKLDKFLEDSV
jgi:hypothetical protein